MLVGGKLTLLGIGVIPIEAEVGDVYVHDKATCALGVVPIGIDTSVQVILPVFSDIIVFFESILKVVGMSVSDIFNTKVVDDDAEEYGAPFLAPKTRRGGALVVYVLG